MMPVYNSSCYGKVICIDNKYIYGVCGENVVSVDINSREMGNVDQFQQYLRITVLGLKITSPGICSIEGVDLI